jgi:hypothetical protein
MRTGVTFILLTTAAIIIAHVSRAGAAAVSSVKARAKALSQAEREAIVAAANNAYKLHVKGPRKNVAPDGIDKDHWGDAIARLKPVRVRNDNVNIAIVLAEKDGVEEGLYVSLPISSYIPTRHAEMLKLSTRDDKAFGTLYYYRSKPKD